MASDSFKVILIYLTSCVLVPRVGVNTIGTINTNNVKNEGFLLVQSTL